MIKQKMTELEQAIAEKRHLFYNHFQVLYTLLQMGKCEQALEYIEKLIEDEKKRNPHFKQG